MQRTDQVFLFGDQAREADCVCMCVCLCVFSFRGSRLIFREFKPLCRVNSHS